MKFICDISYIPLRNEPSDRAEMVSMILFGETYKILESKNEWHRVKNDFDSYEGWIYQRKPLILLTKPPEIKHYTSGKFQKLIPEGPPVYPGLGSPLPFYDEGKAFINNSLYTVDGKVLSSEQVETTGAITQIGRKFLNTPYLWGGRTSYGIDCSGLVQTVFRIGGIPLPRDASMQIKYGTEITPGNHKEGDLAFFINDAGNISHVGIILNEGQILHASEWVRVDDFGEKGIFRDELGKYTHSLFSIRRLK